MTEPTPFAAAEAAADAIRDLNLLTQGRRAGWEKAGDAHSVVGCLAELAARLPQAIGQLHTFVRDLDAAQAPDRNLACAYRGLSDAGDVAQQLSEALSRAHTGINHLTHQD